MRRLAPTLLVTALLAATATAFAVSERLKLEESPVINTKIDHLVSPVCSACPATAREANIGFRLRRENDIELNIATAGGKVMRHRIGSGVFNAAFHTFAWDGRNDAGHVVPDGLYEAQLTLKDEDRTFVFPDEIRVDSTPPRIQDVRIRHSVFSPDGDHRADHVDLRYRFSEPGFAVLYLNGKRLGRTHARARSGTMQWYGRNGVKVLPPGEYRLALAAQDLAGNQAPSTREYAVHLRYIELMGARYVARGPRLRVRVSTDAKAFRWQLGSRGGVVRRRIFTIPVPRRAGRYRLTVTVHGHTARATVVVRRASR